MSIFNQKIITYVIRIIPSFLWPLKILVYKLVLKNVGKSSKFGPNCLFYNHQNIEIGENVFIGDKSTIASTVSVKIGNNVMFGPEVMIIGGDHNFSQIGLPMIQVKKGGKNSPIIIEEDCWIGARAIVLKGVKIREGAVIGAQSLVNRNILPYSINAGNPCKYIKPRFEIPDLKNHLIAVRSKYTFVEISQLYADAGINYSCKD